ncbi:MAG TPA: hypothetical protein VEX86_15105 [Longimicrobium sp.]|nr:hypothetical protein [Longimicrobium sp.]
MKHSHLGDTMQHDTGSHRLALQRTAGGVWRLVERHAPPQAAGPAPRAQAGAHDAAVREAAARGE